LKEEAMHLTQLLIAFFITLILGLLIGYWILKKFAKWTADGGLEIKPAEPYMNPKSANTIIAKENYRILAWYSVYFIIVISCLAHFLGKIKYGENAPYIAFLIFVGLPFLIAFVHVLTKVGDQSNRLLASGYSAGQATAHRMKWLLIVPGLMVLVIDITLQIVNSIR
jgi:hypothetical protein